MVVVVVVVGIWVVDEVKVDVTVTVEVEFGNKMMIVVVVGVSVVVLLLDVVVKLAGIFEVVENETVELSNMGWIVVLDDWASWEADVVARSFVVAEVLVAGVGDSDDKDDVAFNDDKDAVLLEAGVIDIELFF